jgi:hypothetical protein
VRLLDDPQPAEFDAVDQRKSEVMHQQPADGCLVEVGRRYVEPKPRAGQVPGVGEANLEVEVGSMVGHAESVRSDPSPREQSASG